MIQENKPLNGLNSPLVSDKEFVALIESKYHGEGRPQSDIARQAVWNQLEKQFLGSSLNQDANIHSPFSTTVSEAITRIISVAAAAVLLLSVAPLFSDSRLLTSERIKGATDFPLVNITAFAVKNDGELQPVSGSQNQGTTIVFKIDTPKATRVALAMSKADKPPQVRYQAGVLSPGMGRLLKDDGRVYGYELERGDQRLRFCAIASDDEKTLNQRLRLITRVWGSLPSASCVLINAK